MASILSRPRCVNVHGVRSWLCHDMETLFALLTPCQGNPPLRFPHEVPNIRTFDISFVVCPNYWATNWAIPWALAYRPCNVVTLGIIGNVLATTNVQPTIRSWLVLHDVCFNFGKFACMIYRMRKWVCVVVGACYYPYNSYKSTDTLSSADDPIKCISLYEDL